LLPPYEGRCTFSTTGCPIQKSTDQLLFAHPRSLSQLITSFFASESLGIPHTPLFTSLIHVVSFCSYHTTYVLDLIIQNITGISTNNTFLLFHHHVNELFINVFPQYSCLRTAIPPRNQALTTLYFQSKKVRKSESPEVRKVFLLLHSFSISVNASR
jgi:hypothetical protein